jgi:hypothetical protein
MPDSRVLRLLRNFVGDDRGQAMVFVAILIPALVGFSLLTVDMSRVNNLHSDLQNAADAFALAGAAELDGTSDAITRADRAITNLVANESRLSTAGPHTLVIGDIDHIYLDDLPDDSVALDENGWDPDGNDYSTTNPLLARFVMITVDPTGFATIFPASMLGSTDSFNVGATAVAGFKRSVCDATPMFICNPFEAAGTSIQDAFAAGQTYSREFRALKTSSAPGPGNFGLLQTTVPLREAFAKGNGGQCYEQYAVTTKTGVTLGHVNSGLNVRFDIYSGSLSSFKADSAYRPAVNVRKGADKTSNCNNLKLAADGSAMGFPTGTSGLYYSDQSGVSGDGWDRNGYWSINHGVATMPMIPSASNPVATNRPPSRYDIYRYEIANPSLVSDHAGGKNNGETGVPACYNTASVTLTDPAGTPSPGVDRRIIVAAVVNCQANATKIAGQTELQPDGYISIFLTNPIEKEDNTKGPDDETAAEKPIRFEVVDVAGARGRGTMANFLHDEAQLYR